MKKNYSFSRTAITLFAAIILLLNLSSCKSEEQRFKESKETRDRIRAKLTSDYCKEVTFKALKYEMDSVEFAIFEQNRGSINETSESTITDLEYNGVRVESNGKVKGKIKGVTGTWRFYLTVNIDKDSIDTKEFKKEDYELHILDDDGYYLVYKNFYSYGDIEKANNERKKQLETIKEKHKRDVIVNGIKVIFDDEEGASLIYKSEKELTPQQIIGAISKIKRNNANMIQFKSEGHYADYVYATQCIIYTNEIDRIYKVVGGRPIRM